MTNLALKMAEDKWFRKTIAGFQGAWLKNWTSARSRDEFVRGIAGATGLSQATIRRSLPFKNFVAAQRSGKSYLNLALTKIRAAHKAGAWRKGYVAAFGGSAGTVRTTKKRKTKKRKTKTKKTTKKKKGGTKKKVYGTKSAAKSAATKGRYPYKVEGGWALSKKRKSTKRKAKSKKKVYSTKSAAKKAATKGRYPYKVKGGYALSKKQK